MNTDRVGAFLMVWLKDGSIIRCRPDDETALESAMEGSLGVESWKETVDREDRDRLTRLTHLSGARIRLLTSAISGWMLSLREDRERDAAVDAELEREKAAFVAAANPEASGKTSENAPTTIVTTC